VLVFLVAAACSSGGTDEGAAGSCPAKPGSNCAHQDLRSVSLVSADLRGIDLSGADLSNADLRNANLTGANLTGATLSATDFSNATLRDANLTKAFMFGTNFTDADLTGAIRTDATACYVTEPDGALNNGSLVNAQGLRSPCAPTTATTTAGSPSSGPARIEYFRLQAPRECVNDVAGDGVDVEWSAPNASTLAIFVDGLQVASDTRPKGAIRVPFVCNGGPHTVSLQAFGAQPPAATSSFTASFTSPPPLSSGG
jgi:hypothetical protein